MSVLEPCENWDDTRWRNVDGELVLPDTVLLDVFWEARQDIGSVFVHSLRSGGVFVGRILDVAVKRLHSCI